MHFSVLALKCKVWATETISALCVNGACILKTLVLEGQRLFQGFTAAGVWHHNSNTETCFTFYSVKFTAIVATISFKSMSGKKRGVWNPVRWPCLRRDFCWTICWVVNIGWEVWLRLKEQNRNRVFTWVHCYCVSRQGKRVICRTACWKDGV